MVIFSLRFMFSPMTTGQGRIASTKSMVADQARWVSSDHEAGEKRGRTTHRQADVSEVDGTVPAGNCLIPQEGHGFALQEKQRSGDRAEDGCTDGHAPQECNVPFSQHNTQ